MPFLPLFFVDAMQAVRGFDASHDNFFIAERKRERKKDRKKQSTAHTHTRTHARTDASDKYKQSINKNNTEDQLSKHIGYNFF